MENVNEAEPVEVALPEATEGPEAVAIETTPSVNQTVPVKSQGNGTSSSQEKGKLETTKNRSDFFLI